MIKRVFIDSSAWYALRDKDDANHASAQEMLPLLLSERPGLITSNHIIGESYTLIRSSLGHASAFSFLRHIQESPRLERLFTPEEFEKDAYIFLHKYQDQTFSFVDATSFVWMKKLGLTEVFTFDNHFAVAGFLLLPTIKHRT